MMPKTQNKMSQLSLEEILAFPKKIFEDERLSEIKRLYYQRFFPIFMPNGEISEKARFFQANGKYFIATVHDGVINAEASKRVLGEILTSEEMSVLSGASCRLAREKYSKKILETAEKIREWNGPVSDGDKYWSGIDEFLEDKANDGEDLPDFIFTVTEGPMIPHIDITDILERYLDVFEEIPELNGEKELQAAMDKFFELNTEAKRWEVNEKKILLLDEYKEGFEKLKKEEEL